MFGNMLKTENSSAKGPTRYSQSSLFFIKVYLFILREREGESEQGRGRERESERESQAGSVLLVQSPTGGLHTRHKPTNPES